MLRRSGRLRASQDRRDWLGWCYDCPDERLGNAHVHGKGLLSSSQTGRRLGLAWQATNVVSLWAQSLPGRWPSALGMFAWVISDVGKTLYSRRSLLYRRLHVGV